MPKWNLLDDWPKELIPVNKATNLPDVLFSLPIRTLVAAEDTISLSLIRPNNFAKLILDIDDMQVDALAMVPGMITCAANEITLTTDIFSIPGVSNMLMKQTQQSQGDFPVAWFDNWRKAGTVPGKIVYENVEPFAQMSGSTKVNVGEVIGTVLPSPQDPARKLLRLSIEYTTSAPEKCDSYLTFPTPKCMHPREFFSLLFWDEKCDPILKENPDTYQHPLLRKMMMTCEDGNPISLADKAKQLTNRPIDDWLGLRPPLRTYQRIKWEHIKEHLRNDTLWNSDSDVQDRIKNPFTRWYSGYKGAKCNIFAGEMLFRAGFRTIVWGGGIGCETADSLPGWLKYDVPRWKDGQDGLFNNFSNNPKSRPRGQIRRNPNSAAKCNVLGTTYTLSTPFGQKESCGMDSLNNQIHNSGACFLFVSHEHVCIIDQVNSCAPTTTVKVIDQWPGVTRNSYSHTYSKPQNEVVILRMFPGGDPTETWGAMDLNCLREA